MINDKFVSRHNHTGKQNIYTIFYFNPLTFGTTYFTTGCLMYLHGQFLTLVRLVSWLSVGRGSWLSVGRGSWLSGGGGDSWLSGGTDSLLSGGGGYSWLIVGRGSWLSGGEDSWLSGGRGSWLCGGRGNWSSGGRSSCLNGCNYTQNIYIIFYFIYSTEKY